jgi:4-hydroxy-tetrahydrodipicolinate reductase
MGTAVGEAWRERGHEVAATVGRGDPVEAAAGVDVAFEFAGPKAAEDNVAALLRLDVPVVCGSTGWEPEAVADLARRRGVPLLVAPNFSVGVAVLRELVAEAARRFAAVPGFDAGILERHHAGKLDSPSGTARLLAVTVAEAGGGGEPPVVSLRQGGQPGEHRVIFEGADEEVELVHRARSRRVFALGAALAGEWLARERPPGPVDFATFLTRSRG